MNPIRPLNPSCRATDKGGRLGDNKRIDRYEKGGKAMRKRVDTSSAIILGLLGIAALLLALAPTPQLQEPAMVLHWWIATRMAFGTVMNNTIL